MAQAPVHVTLHLDERKLPAQVFEHLSHRAGILADRQARNKQSVEDFGKPGRDPSSFTGVLGAIAEVNGWIPYMKQAQLRMDWASVVGEQNAQHTWVQGYADGVLYIGVESPVWATTMQFLLPQLRQIVPQKLEGLEIRDIRISGNQQQTRRGKAHPRRYPGRRYNAHDRKRA
ncbi:Zn-ribbon-containing, RNA-binding like protein [Bifidobacterium dolichotidis]|uniref:Zn-ribbon-containing, RNA-binding like protein n=1 Tax=Bifidobacterium dolichotidis TaxID=2306976 RepID=A0A430FNY9_9BIFI|nr:DUF721 domain-containing protein [Bifidobacterium dolichotidis]RSX54539.1 Zn-ribbon-containing, RNA-binding like protein [Bifidobacterium dolichotidis]